MQKRKKRPRLALIAEDGYYYHPEKARNYRKEYEVRKGVSWNEHIYNWRKAHPQQYHESNRRSVAKSRLVRRLGLKMLLAEFGLPEESSARFLRALSANQLELAVRCVKDWDRVAGNAPRSASTLLNLVYEMESTKS